LRLLFELHVRFENNSNYMTDTHTHTHTHTHTQSFHVISKNITVSNVYPAWYF